MASRAYGKYKRGMYLGWRCSPFGHFHVVLARAEACEQRWARTENPQRNTILQDRACRAIAELGEGSIPQIAERSGLTKETVKNVLQTLYVHRIVERNHVSPSTGAHRPVLWRLVEADGWYEDDDDAV